MTSPKRDNPAGPSQADDAMEVWFNTDPVLCQARRDGVDVWALWANLQRPVEERIRRHQIALHRFMLLYNARRINENGPYCHIVHSGKGKG